MDKEGVSARPFRYVLASAEAKKWGLQVSALGQLSISANPKPLQAANGTFSQFVGRHDPQLSEYHLILVHEGTGTFQSSETTSDLRSGDAVVLFPGIWHRFQAENKSQLSLRWLRICGSFVDHMAKQRFMEPNHCILHLPPPSPLPEQFERMLHEVARFRTCNPLAISAIAMEMLAEVCWASQQQSDQFDASHQPLQAMPVADPVVAKALNLIWESGNCGIGIPELVKQLPVSRRSLERRFQEIMGCSLLSEITHCRVERAKTLLQETNMPIKQLAGAAGFASSEAFTRAFQRQVGVTPGQYRRERKKMTDPKVGHRD